MAKLEVERVVRSSSLGEDSVLWNGQVRVHDSKSGSLFVALIFVPVDVSTAFLH